MPKPVYALVGEDSFLQLQRLARIRAQFPSDVQSIDFDGERAELAEVLDELRSFAMFGGGGKLVVVRNADEFVSKYRDPLEDYLARPSDSGTLVLRLKSLPKTTRIYKMIDKGGEVESCDPPELGARLVKWITDRAAKEHKLTVEPAAANQLADLIGNDLGRLDNELAKLALQVDGGRVTPEAVLTSVSFQREQEMYDMTNELALGRPDEALRRWRRLVQLDTSAEFRAVVWLTMWLEDVGAVLSGSPSGKIQWKYKDRYPEFLKVSRSMGWKRHQRALDLLAETDRRTKSGLGAAADNVEQFILSFATPAGT